jgi:DNA polymerase III subunit delta'
MELPAALDDHPHARAVLAPAWPPRGRASHAYLFHGPAGTGKRTVARALAAALLAEGAEDALGVGERVRRGAHPDLTWVVPSGANEMLVGDIEEAVVGAVARTPFESSRRVFVIEGAHTMSDQVANRLLKTLEEPPTFAHLILLTQGLGDVLPTVASRCQHVRFDPLSPARIEERLGQAFLDGERPGQANASPAREQSGASPELRTARMAACARLALGDAGLAQWLASEPGQSLRESAEEYVRGALAGRTGERAWLGVLEQAKAAGVAAGEESLTRSEEEFELVPAKERKRLQREAGEAQRRIERRERTRTLDLALALAELWLRDVWCTAEGAPELAYAVDRSRELAQDAAGSPPARLLAGVELVAASRRRLALNVGEELALEALAYRLEGLLARSDAASSGATRREAVSRSTSTAAR